MRPDGQTSVGVDALYAPQAGHALWQLGLYDLPHTANLFRDALRLNASTIGGIFCRSIYCDART